MAENAVRKFLYSSEDAKIVLEAQLTLSSADPVAHISPDFDDPGDAKRILAVVTHRDRLDGREEGSVFVFKCSSDLSPFELQIQHVYPIVRDFTLTMAQARRGTLDVSSLTRNSLLDQPRSGLTLTINPGEGPSTEPLTLLTSDVYHLRSVLAECKRLKEVYDITASFTSGETHTWLAPYLTKQNPVLRFSSSIPLDLRIARRALHTRLSHNRAGYTGDELADIQLIRDEWAHARARDLSRQDFENETMTIRIRLGTFNVNGKMPSQDLSTWLRGHFRSATSAIDNEETIERNVNAMIPPLKFESSSIGGYSPSDSITLSDTQFDPQTTVINPISIHTTSSSETNLAKPPMSPTSEDADDGPEIIVLAFQELDLSAEALLYSSSTTREDAWCMAVFAGLGEKAALYTKLASRQLVGMLLLVIAKTTLKPCFQGVETCAVGTGIMGVMGNKGGIGLRMKFSPPPTADVPFPLSATFTFVNTHLAAFDEMVDRRHVDFHDLSRRLVFPLESSLEGHFAREDSPPLSIFECDALFWMGDFNYRLDLADSDVRSILGMDQWVKKFETLLEHDQLIKAMRTKRAFHMFHEYPITFLPTYRFGTGLRDELGYDLKRKPAWTDRILHVSGPSIHVQQLSYSSHREITMSDHRPVSADFTVSIATVDRTKYDMAIYKLYRQVSDLEESEERPIIKLDPTAIDIGRVSYKHTLTRTFSLQNQGNIACAFHFVPLELDTPVHPTWLKVEPMAGLVLPQETLVVTLTVYVDNESASRLSLVSKEIASTLILHVARGKDHFISIAGQYEFTCFGNKLSDLVRMDRPIRAIETMDDLLHPDRALNAPREILRLIDWLMANATDVDGLFVLPAEADLVNTIRECLDTGVDFPYNSPQERSVVLAFGGALLQLLDSLVEPVVPPSLHARCMQVKSRSEAFEVLDTFPSVSVNVLLSLTAFLQYVVQQPPVDASQSNFNKIESLASVFAPILLRDDPSSTYPPASPLAKYNFLVYFLS